MQEDQSDAEPPFWCVVLVRTRVEGDEGSGILSLSRNFPEWERGHMNPNQN